MGIVFLTGAGVSESSAAGVPPSFCKSMKIKKSDSTTLYAWLDADENAVYTKSQAPASGDAVYTKNGTRMEKSANTVTSYNSGTTSIVVDEVTYTKTDASDETVVIYSLNWKDPEDTILDDQLICSWAGTKIVRKSGDYPTSLTDGVEVLDNANRDTYASTVFEDIIIDTENDYSYKAYPYSQNGVVCVDKRNNFGSAIIYEYIIDPSNSNPKSRVTYAGENSKYTSAYMDCTADEFKYNSWEDAFFMDLFKPCMQKYDKTVDYFLCPTDLTKKEDGVTASDVANTSYGGNAMVQVGQIWIKEVNEGEKQHVFIANQKVDDDYDCFTHLKSDGTYNEFYYRAIYDGSNISNKIRSLSDQATCKSLAGNTQIAYARANGSGWDADEYCYRRLINHLLVLMGKSTNTQDIFGTGRYTGYVNGSNTNQLNTGTNDKKGMFYGDNNNGCVTVFYHQNWWGNIWKITQGLLQSAGKLFYKMCPSTQDGSTVADYQQTSATGYIDSGVTLPGTIIELYQKEMTLVPHLGLVPMATTGGSSTTFYADGLWSNPGVVGFARFGSSPYNGFLVGAFALSVHNAVADSNWDYGVALSCRPTS